MKSLDPKIEVGINRLFDSYFLANKNLWSYFQEFGQGEEFTIVIDTKTFRRPPNPNAEPIDYGIHTCGLSTFPDELNESHFSKNWTKYVEWTEAQQMLIENAYKKIIWDLELFQVATHSAKNCWPSYLYERAWHKRIKKSQNSHNLQRGDILAFLSPNWDEVVGFLSDSTEFKDLKSRIPYKESGNSSISVNIFDISESYPEFKIKERFISGVSDDLKGKVDEEEVSLIVENYWQDLKNQNDLDIEALKKNGIVEDVWNPKPAISAKIFELFCLENYECEHFQMAECLVCKRSFYPQAQRIWPFLLPPNYCDFCLGMVIHHQVPDFFQYGFSESEIKANMIFGVQSFFEIFGFIPKSGQNRAKTILKSLDNLNFDVDVLIVLKAIALLPTKELADEYFTSWPHLLAEANLLELTNRGKGGYRSIATDGHLCLSLGERAICEFLSSNGIEHSKEPLYPKHQKMNPNGLLRGDFLIGTIFVEFAGMMQNDEYAERMRNKQSLAKAKKIPWIKLETAEFEDLDRLKNFIDSHKD